MPHAVPRMQSSWLSAGKRLTGNLPLQIECDLDLSSVDRLPFLDRHARTAFPWANAAVKKGALAVLGSNSLCTWPYSCGGGYGKCISSLALRAAAAPCFQVRLSYPFLWGGRIHPTKCSSWISRATIRVRRTAVRRPWFPWTDGSAPLGSTPEETVGRWSRARRRWLQLQPAKAPRT